jgi:branched-chain amino acid transport system permease protein
MALLLQFILNGIAIGAVYALVAVGYTLIYGVMKFINFAHGDMVMVGAFIFYAASKGGHLGFAGALLVAAISTALLGTLLYLLAYRPLRRATRLAPLISAIGVSIALRGTAAWIFGPEIRSVQVPAVFQSINVAGAVLPGREIEILLIAASMAIVLVLLLLRSSLGICVRAVADDREAAEASGLRTELLIVAVFAAASAIGAVGGVMVAASYDLSPSMGTLLGLKAFTASVIGGIGNVTGALVAGVMVGVFENLAAGYLGSAYKDAWALALLAVFLLAKPTGLFAPAASRKV